MYLHITLNSGRKFNDGLKQRIIEVVECTYGIRNRSRQDNDYQPAVSWQTPHWKPSYFNEIEGFVYLDESDVAILKSNDGMVIHEWHGAKKSAADMEYK